MLDHVVHERVYARRARATQHGDRLSGELLLSQQARAHGVVDVVIDVSDAVDHPHDPALERLRLRGAARVAQDSLTHLLGEIQAFAVPLEVLDDAQRVLVVAKARSKACLQAAVEHLLAYMPERRMPEIVSQPDRLDQVLVQLQRPRDRARDSRDLERVREARAVVVPARSDEHLRLVRQAPKRLAVHDPVAVALKGRTQGAIVLRPHPARRVGARRERREPPLLLLADTGRKLRRDGVLGARDAHSPGRPLPQKSSSAVALPVAASAHHVHPVVPALHLARILPKHRRGSSRLRQALRSGRVDPQIDAPLVQGGDVRGLDEPPTMASGGDHDAVEDVLLGRRHHVIHRAHLSAVTRQDGDSALEDPIRDRQSLIHPDHDTGRPRCSC